MLLAFLIGLFASEPPSRLAVIRDAPDFTLVSQAGKPVRRTDLPGRVLLVSFIFTTCSGSCPATTHRLGQVQQALKEQGLLRSGQVHLFSITLDPERDTPEVLRRYMKAYDVDESSWTFLTGSPAEAARTWAAWDMWARPAAAGQLDHPSRVFLVDRRGRIREIYNLDFLRVAWVVEDIRLLLAEPAARRQDGQAPPEE